MPFVSVCIPTYENPFFALRAVTSVFEQTFSDFECIVTDDSASETVAEALSPFFSDARFRYIKNRPPLGPPANWNSAIKLATGNYIKLLHHDDAFASPNALASFVRTAESSPHCGFIVANTYKIHAHSKVPFDISADTVHMLRRNPFMILIWNFIGVPSVTMVLRDLAEEYDNNLKWFVDIEYYKRLLDRTDVAHIPERLINVNVIETGRITESCLADPDLQLRELLYIFKKHSPLYVFRGSAAHAIFVLLSRFADPLAALRRAGMPWTTLTVYAGWHAVFSAKQRLRENAVSDR